MQRNDGTKDESLGHFLERRLGRELLEHIAEPLLAGIYAGDTYKLSLQSTFPQFLDAEREYNSVIRGTQQGRKQTLLSPHIPEEVRHSMFLSYRNGLFSLIEALEASLAAVQIRTETTVEHIAREENRYKVKLADGALLEADGIIVAVPTFAAAKLMAHIPAMEPLGEMDYVSVANVIMAFDKEGLSHAMDGSGFLVPRGEGRAITACTWTSSKWAHTAPAIQRLHMQTR